MLNVIDDRKLKLKHYLRVYNLLENYPKEEDVLFELASNIDIINGVSFSNKDIQDLLITKVKIGDLNNLLSKLEKQNYIQIIENKSSNKHYKLLKHNW